MVTLADLAQTGLGWFLDLDGYPCARLVAPLRGRGPFAVDLKRGEGAVAVRRKPLSEVLRLVARAAAPLAPSLAADAVERLQGGRRLSSGRGAPHQARLADHGVHLLPRGSRAHRSVQVRDLRAAVRACVCV